MAGVGSNANYIPTVWSPMVQKQRERNLVMANLVDRWDNDVKEYGGTIKRPMLGNQTARTKVAGTTVSFVANTEGVVTIGITTMAYLADVIEDMAQVQARYDLTRLYTDKFGYGIAAKVDSDLLGTYSSFAQTVGATASNVGIGYTNIIRANRTLNGKDAPATDRALVVDPIGYEQLLQITNFVRYDAVGQGGKDNPIFNGKVGMVFGTPVYMTNQVSGDGSYHYGLMFQKEAIALALQKDVQVKSQYGVEYLGTKLAVYNIYGFGIARTDHAVVLIYGDNGTGVG